MWRKSWVIWMALALAGCESTRGPRSPSLSSLPAPLPVAESGLQPASHTELPLTVLTTPGSSDRAVSETELIREVLARNPTLEEMQAAVVAAQARAPQVSSLDDPMVTAWTSPETYRDGGVDPAVRLEVSQKLPWPGKLETRAAAASAEAGAAVHDLAGARLELVAATRAALADYFLAERGLDVNREIRTLLTELRQAAESRYRTGVGLQQDLLQADVELAKVEERAVILRRAQRVAQARLNTLMHRPADTAIGAAPATLPDENTDSDAAALRAAAVAARPDVKALSDRIRAEEAALAAAGLEYRPDVEVMAAYDRYWQGMDRPMQWQLGARINVPIRTGRRDAGVVEAQARLARKRAELTRLTDRIGLEVQEAHAELTAARQVIALYEEKLLPAARANIKSARAEYTTGKVPFVVLSDSQRTLAEYQERYLEAQADLYRRRAALDRVLGRGDPDVAGDSR